MFADIRSNLRKSKDRTFNLTKEPGQGSAEFKMTFLSISKNVRFRSSFLLFSFKRSFIYFFRIENVTKTR